ncbi:hypothetical protein [Methylobacterium sp. SI9]|uniref:hypothetical protein n=1 Tax=Methylobacterium guangdongense TaxID=3138811 RepID=UPI00313AE74D
MAPACVLERIEPGHVTGPMSARPPQSIAGSAVTRAALALDENAPSSAHQLRPDRAALEARACPASRPAGSAVLFKSRSKVNGLRAADCDEKAAEMWRRAARFSAMYSSV